ncbi:MAG: hypothetical protein AAFQ82_07340, partial [Myxococcota bacterium]
MRQLLAAVVCVGLGAACVDPPPHVILQVTDPNNLADDAETLALGRDLTALKTVPLDGRDFPVELTIDGFEAGEIILFWVDALDANGDVLARGRVRLEFPSGQSGTATVVLASPCSDEDPGTVGCALPDAPGELGVCIQGRCGESFCGDGVVNGDAGETCDDGNENTQDACPDGPSGTCIDATCGDGYLHNGIEPCDDGNLVNEDRCRSEVGSDGVRVCIINVCGDGFANADIDPATNAPFEECDDGNSVDTDACRVITVGESVRCVANVCGDGIQNALEENGAPIEACDDGNDNPNDFCNACARPDWSANVLLGTGDNAGRPTLEDGRPESLSLNFVTGLITDNVGDLYIADQNGRRIWRWDASANRITAVAGFGGAAVVFDPDSPASSDFGDGG